MLDGKLYAISIVLCNQKGLRAVLFYVDDFFRFAQFVKKLVTQNMVFTITLTEIYRSILGGIRAYLGLGLGSVRA